MVVSVTMMKPEYQAMLQLGEARHFLEASRELSSNVWSSPKYYLQIHAIELAGKAYLLLNGRDPQRVANIRHDLLKLFRRCRRHGLRLNHPRADWIIGLIAPVHADHRLRYITAGETELPSFDELDGFCEELIRHGAQLVREWESREASEEDAGDNC
jgi:hypothetical protein